MAIKQQTNRLRNLDNQEMLKIIESLQDQLIKLEDDVDAITDECFDRDEYYPIFKSIPEGFNLIHDTLEHCRNVIEDDILPE